MSNLNEIKIDYDNLENETKIQLENWIKNIKSSDEFNYNHSSYALYKIFNNIIDSLGYGNKINNNIIKYAMYLNNFKPDNYNDDNWFFKIAEQQQFTW